MENPDFNWQLYPEMLGERLAMLSKYTSAWALERTHAAPAAPVFRVHYQLPQSLDKKRTEWYDSPLRAIDEATVEIRKE